jgi:hypothetical protein
LANLFCVGLQMLTYLSSRQQLDFVHLDTQL